ncbi:MAG: hypothetical protein ACOY45_04725 [Pseudomonadota bacterium]
MARAVSGVYRSGSDAGFFLGMVLVMAAFNVAGFGLFALMGLSSFGAPLYIHVHALLFFGWVALLVTQAMLAATGSVGTHRRLGWLALAWVPAMIVAGTTTTVFNVQAGRVPFLFLPAYFLVMNPLTVLTFAGLVFAGIARRRDTAWHRRLILSGMAAIMGPTFGRLVPPPIQLATNGFINFALCLAFPIAGAVRDWRRTGRVHPAWLVGIVALVVMQAAIEILGHSALALSFYDWVVAGTPGAATPGLVPLPIPPMS